MTQLFPRRALSAALLFTASSLAMSTPASANQTLFASDPGVGQAATAGERVTQQGGVTQLRLDNGGTASFVDGASYQLRRDGSIDLFSGSVTVAGNEAGAVVVRLADQGEGKVQGRGSAASFSVDGTGARGHALTGTVVITIGTAAPRSFSSGQMWHRIGGHAELALAIGEAPVPDSDATAVSPMRHGGPLAAAENGVPVVLGDALAATGASGDIVSAARRVQAAAAEPSLESFPSGDLSLLVGYAARLEGAYGGQPFAGAQADVIRTYLQYLGTGGSGAQFLTVYAGLMTQYLDLVRAGTLPSSFRGASLIQINSFIAFRGRTSGFAALSAQNRTLIDAYLAFILGGGNADQFSGRYTSMTDAYFIFLRGGGDPAAFQGASQSTVNAYLVFLRDSGLSGQLSATNQALLTAYLASFAGGGNGLAFADQYKTVLTAYYDYLQQGRLPSGYTAVDAATLRSYLESLKATGLFDRVLGGQAGFYSSYLLWLQGGGSVDGFAGLPANIYTGYSAQLRTYYIYLLNGGIPSAYTGLTQQQIRDYLSALQTAGASDVFLTDLSQFYTAYFAYLAGGANPDLYAGLPNVDFAGYASQLATFVTYLQGGGLPANYTGLTAAQIQAYLNALSVSGKLGTLLPADASFLSAYFTYLQTGGAPNGYSGLPAYAGYVTSLQAYYVYLQGGGLPSGYSALTLAQLQAYIKALQDAGVFTALLSGTQLSFFTSYYTYVAGGGTPNGFSGLPASGTTPPAPAFAQVSPASGYVVSVAAGVGGISGTFGTVGPGITHPVTFAANGAPTNINVATGTNYTYEFLAGTATPLEMSGNTFINIGRYTAGTTGGLLAATLNANQGMHYLVMTPPTNLPTTGTIDYTLLAATKPTYATGTTAPGTFDGKLRIAFGSQARAAYLGTITMPSASGSTVYNFGTQANYDNAATLGGLLSNVVIMEPLTGSAASCGASGCVLQLMTAVGGDAGAYVGTSYFATVNTTNNERLTGTAIFGAPGTSVGTVTSGGGSGGSTATAAPTGAGLRYRGAGAYYLPNGTISSIGIFRNDAAAITAQAGGQLDVVQASTTVTDTRGTASNVDMGQVAGVLAWSRWEGGSLSYTVLTPTSTSAATTENAPANGGMSHIWGAPVTAMPATGTASYTMIGSTKPTRVDASLTPGSVTDASLAVAFATQKVGFEAHVAIGGQTLAMNSTGGIAAPSMALAADGTFGAPINGALLYGFLAGPAASHAGVSYYLGTGTTATAGVIAFAKGP